MFIVIFYEFNNNTHSIAVHYRRITVRQLSTKRQPKCNSLLARIDILSKRNEPTNISLQLSCSYTVPNGLSPEFDFLLLHGITSAFWNLVFLHSSWRASASVCCYLAGASYSVLTADLPPWDHPWILGTHRTSLCSRRKSRNALRRVKRVANKGGRLMS